MINFLFNHISKNLKKYSYQIKNIIFFTVMMSLAIPLSFIFDNLCFIIISSIMINIIQKFTYSFHCKNLDNCIFTTNILFLIFGYLSKQSVDYLWVVFCMSIFCIKDIYIKAPLKPIVKNKDEKWHKLAFIRVTAIFILIALIFIKLNFLEMANCILWTYILFDLMLFLNE